MNEISHLGFAPQSPALFTLEEFQRLVDNDILRGGDKLELDEGVIVRMSPAMTPHMRLKRHIFRALDPLFDEREYEVHTELSVKLGPATLRDIDVGVIRPFPLDQRDYADPADVLLAVEVSHTTLDYDLGRKAWDYARNAIPHYWVVDVEHALTHLFGLPSDARYAEHRRVAFGQPLTVPGTRSSITIG